MSPVVHQINIPLLQISPHSLLGAELFPCQRSLAQGKHMQPATMDQSPKTHLFLGKLQALRLPETPHHQVKPTGDGMWCHWFSFQQRTKSWGSVSTLITTAAPKMSSSHVHCAHETHLYQPKQHPAPLRTIPAAGDVSLYQSLCVCIIIHNCVS